MNTYAEHKRLTGKIRDGLLLLIISVLVFSMYIKDPGIDNYYTVNYGDMIYGKAYKPFVTRALLPATIRLTVYAFPQQFRTFLTHIVIQNSFINSLFDKLRWNKTLAAEYIIGLIMMFASLLAFVYAAGILWNDLYEAPRFSSTGVRIAMLLGLPPCFKYFSHIYDFPSLMFFTIGMILIYRQNWKYFIPLFAVSCINKETTILLTMVFAFYFYRRGKLSVSLYRDLLILQIAIFLAVRVILTLIFYDNPGGVVESHIPHNIGLIKAYNFTMLGGILFLIFLLAHKWNEKPALLRRAIYILPILVILAFFFGFLDEFRAYYEAYPVVMLLGAYSFLRLTGANIQTRI